MHRLIAAGCMPALFLLIPILSAQEKTAENPALTKLNRDIDRHKEFLKRIEKTKAEGDVIFLAMDSSSVQRTLRDCLAINYHPQYSASSISTSSASSPPASAPAPLPERGGRPPES